MVRPSRLRRCSFLIALSAMAQPDDRPVLLLLCSAGGLLYAMESRLVVEVIPRVSLRPVLDQADAVAGIFNYRGVAVPVVDLCQLLHGRPSRAHLSTRIIMVAGSGDNGVPGAFVGLLAEGVTDTLSRPLSAFQGTPIAGRSGSWLGGLYLDDRLMVQLLHLDRLLLQLCLPDGLAEAALDGEPL